MTRRIIAISVLLVALVQCLRAQLDVQFSDYTALKSYYNPAVSGTNGQLSVQAAYAMQMTGYEGAPNTMYVGADMPIYFIGPRHGFGLNFLNDEIGMFKQVQIGVQYAYNAKLGQKGRLAVGVHGGLLNETIDPSGVELDEPNDPAFPTSSVKGNSVDLGAGLYYYHPNMWVGLSGQHLTAPVIELGEKNEVELTRMYYLMGGCNIKIKNSFLSVQPSFLVQSNLTSWREDVQCKVTYEYEGRKFFGGVGYSPDISTTFMLGGVFHDITLGYSYQMYTSGIGMVNGSHELTLGYQTDLDLFKKGRNKHKSVRWL